MGIIPEGGFALSYTDPTPPPRPAPEVRVTEVRGSNTTGWVAAAVVALVAIIAVTFMVTNRSAEPDATEVARAIEQGRTEGMLAGAQSTLDSARATTAAVADRTAAEASQAAADARAAADEAARSATDAASNASDSVTVTEPVTTDQPAPQ